MDRGSIPPLAWCSMRKIAEGSTRPEPAGDNRDLSVRDVGEDRGRPGGPVEYERVGGLVRYGLSRALVLFLILLIVPYLIIGVINRDGTLDEMHRSRIRYEVVRLCSADPDLQELPPAEFQRLVDEAIQEEFIRQEFDRPFLRRNFTHLWRATILDLGWSQTLIGDSREVRPLLAERVGRTSLLFGTAMILMLLISLFVDLAASRHRGRFLDRLGTMLAPFSAVPGWFYGIFLILIVSAVGLPPPGGMADFGLSPGSPGYVLSVLRHLILPVSAISLGSIFVAIYSWRTFFVGRSSDERIESAGAGRSSSATSVSGSFLRPTPPRAIIYFLVLVTSLLMGSIIVEMIFNWPGLGRLLYQAIQVNQTPVILGSLVIYGYVLAFLAVMVFVLDFLDVWLIQRRASAGAPGGS